MILKIRGIDVLPKLYTYIITNDNGFSPCYDEGVFTLACCKPQIRRAILKKYKEKISSGKEDAWLCGIQRENKKAFIVFLAKINRVFELQEYYKEGTEYTNRLDCRYRNIGTIYNDKGKLPVTVDKDIIKKNFKYAEALENNEHGKACSINKMNKNHLKDIGGASVLMSTEFIHCTCSCFNGDKFKLTDDLKSALSGILSDYQEKNQRIYHSFNDFEALKKATAKLELNKHYDVKPLQKTENCKKVCAGC